VENPDVDWKKIVDNWPAYKKKMEEEEMKRKK
jgi:hypothetical protein